MAQIHTETIVITFNKLVKDVAVNVESIATEDIIVTEDIIAALVSVAEELAGPGIIVEVELA